MLVNILVQVPCPVLNDDQYVAVPGVIAIQAFYCITFYFMHINTWACIHTYINAHTHRQTIYNRYINVRTHTHTHTLET